MKKVYGIIEIGISQAEPALWWDSDKKQTGNKGGWGIVLKLLAGSFARPCSKFWLGINPWQEKVWFTIRLPFIILPFLTVAIGEYGFYFGGKAFTVDPDEPWARESEYGTQMLTFSVSLRRHRWGKAR